MRRKEFSHQLTSATDGAQEDTQPLGSAGPVLLMGALSLKA